MITQGEEVVDSSVIMHSACLSRKKRRTHRERTALTHECCTAPHRQVGTCTHTCIRVHIHANIHAYIHANIHAYIHANIHAYIHTALNGGSQHSGAQRVTVRVHKSACPKRMSSQQMVHASAQRVSALSFLVRRYWFQLLPRRSLIVTFVLSEVLKARVFARRRCGGFCGSRSLSDPGCGHLRQAWPHSAVSGLTGSVREFTVPRARTWEQQCRKEILSSVST